MSRTSPDVIVGLIEVSGAYYKSRVAIDDQEATFPRGDKVRLTEPEASSLREMLTRLKLADAMSEYPADGTSPMSSSCLIEVTSPPTLAMKIRATEPNANIPGEIREISSLVTSLGRRITRAAS